MDVELKTLIEKIDRSVEDVKTASTKDRENISAWRKEVDDRIKSQDDLIASMRQDNTGLPGSDLGKDYVDGFVVKALFGIANANQDPMWRSIPDGPKVKDILTQSSDRYWSSEQGRAMSTLVGSSGGYVVPNEYLARIVEYQTAQSVLFQAGATPLTGLTSSPIQIPRETGDVTAYDIAENAQITASAPTLGQLTLSPKGIAALTEMSRLSQLLSNPSLMQIVERRITNKLAIHKDLRCMTGTGSSNQPLGIVNQPSVGSVAIGTNGGTCEYDHLVQLEGVLEDSNYLMGRLGLVMNGKVRRKFARQLDSDGRPLFNRERNANGQMERTLYGYPYYISTQLPSNLTKGTLTTASYVIFGKFDSLLIGQWGNLILEATTQAGNYFAYHQAAVKAVDLFDCACEYAGAEFGVIADAATV